MVQRCNVYGVISQGLGSMVYDEWCNGVMVLVRCMLLVGILHNPRTYITDPT